jgi:hypothetical protein
MAFNSLRYLCVLCASAVSSLTPDTQLKCDLEAAPEEIRHLDEEGSTVATKARL